MNDPLPRCQVVPLPEDQVALVIDGQQRTRWHFGPQYPRPFFFPLVDPAGRHLTRMGHPGDWGHDHHRSIWFGHHVVGGINFWNDQTQARIRQKRWLCYQDGHDEAAMAVLLSWQDPAGNQLLEQELVAVIRPRDAAPAGGNDSAVDPARAQPARPQPARPEPGDPQPARPEPAGAQPPGAVETLLMLQSTFRAAKSVELSQTNFGFLAVRVARSVSAYFGGGQLHSSEGLRGEAALFGKPAAWMDYSGPVAAGEWSGITYFDHPSNPRYPSKWHVREDGWMGASVCRDGPLVVAPDKPLVLKYLLHAHAGALNAPRAAALAAEFAHDPGYVVVKADRPHVGFEVMRPRPAS